MMFEKNSPEFKGIIQWLNSKPLTMKGLKGKVVMVDFWTYTCVNCLRTLPFMKKMHEKYKDQGLIIIGVHSPEFDFEKDINNVKEAVNNLDINYPVAIDSEMKTWDAFKNNCWPKHYMIDKTGAIRYTHAGEGDYEDIEKRIIKLLSEINKIDIEPEEIKNPRYEFSTSGELYCGSLRNEGLGSTTVCTPEGCRYIDNERHHDDVIYLDGEWVQEKEYLENNGSGYLILSFRAKSMNLVITPVNEKATIKIIIDDKTVKEMTIDKPAMYNLFDSDEFKRYKLKILVDDKIRFFAFTFG